MERPELSESEERIFEAALQVFARKGKDGARMQEIADVAGINKAMLHYYFRNKDTLYTRVFDYVISRLLRTFAAALFKSGGDSLASALRVLINTYTDFIASHTDVMRVMVGELLAGGDVVQRRIARIFQDGEVAAVFVNRVEEAIASGEIRPVDPRHLLVTVAATCIFPFIAFPIVETIIPEARDDRAAFLEARKEHVFQVLYEGIRSR